MTSLETYNKHALQNRELTAFLERSTSGLGDLPICPKCETIGLRDKGWREKGIMCCPKCGYNGSTTKTYRDFIEELLFT